MCPLGDSTTGTHMPWTAAERDAERRTSDELLAMLPSRAARTMPLQLDWQVELAISCVSEDIRGHCPKKRSSGWPRTADNRLAMRWVKASFLNVDGMQLVGGDEGTGERTVCECFLEGYSFRRVCVRSFSSQAHDDTLR